jgi:hypothetical protein
MLGRLYLYCRGLAGYLKDLAKIASGNFSNPHSYTKFLAIKRLKKAAGAKTLIEAGTFRGIMAARCSQIFERVYTIELDHNLAVSATRYLRNKKNVKVIEGDALEVIPELLEREEFQSVLLFLDGHYSRGETACGDLPEPAAEELRALVNYRDKINAIVIDDLRSFGTEQDFPKKSELLKAAEDSFGSGSGFNIDLFLDQLIIRRDQSSD